MMSLWKFPPHFFCRIALILQKNVPDFQTGSIQHNNTTSSWTLQQDVYEIETGKETASYTYDATAQRWARTSAVGNVDFVESFEIPFPPKPPLGWC